jgi:glycosyltransferase involved in cell wall biosynthesis
MGKVGVMHLIDTLEFGGAERVAVNLVNYLPRDRYDVTLCSTRADGPLAAEVAPDVTRLSLGRRHRFDSAAVRRLAGFVRDHNVGILHAHGTSLFLARLVAALSGNQPRIVWHDHYGPMDRPVWLYRLATRGVSAVLAVNASLAEWAKRKLQFRAERVWYVPNFVCPGPAGNRSKPDLPGIPGSRIACVANLRPEKDHLNLLRAMQIIARQMPAAHLLLLGGAPSQEYLRRVEEEVEANNLGANVTLLGLREDVPAILRSCDVGVLGSYSEGLPLSLLEYGMAGLPAVATSVGQCPEVLDGGRAGILVPPKSPESLAHAILFLLDSPEKRAMLGRRLEEHVRSAFNPESITNQICCVYDMVTRSR